MVLFIALSLPILTLPSSQNEYVMPNIPVKKKRVTQTEATAVTSTAASASTSTAASAAASTKSPSIRTRTKKSATQAYNFRPRSRDH